LILEPAVSKAKASRESVEKPFIPARFAVSYQALRVLAAYLIRAWDIGAEARHDSVCPKRDRPDRYKSSPA
jgi:hypothetical protein